MAKRTLGVITQTRPYRQWPIRSELTGRCRIRLPVRSVAVAGLISFRFLFVLSFVYPVRKVVPNISNCICDHSVYPEIANHSLSTELRFFLIAISETDEVQQRVTSDAGLFCIKGIGEIAEQGIPPLAFAFFKFTMVSLKPR